MFDPGLWKVFIPGVWNDGRSLPTPTIPRFCNSDFLLFISPWNFLGSACVCSCFHLLSEHLLGVGMFELDFLWAEQTKFLQPLQVLQHNAHVGGSPLEHPQLVRVSLSWWIRARHRIPALVQQDMVQDMVQSGTHLGSIEGGHIFSCSAW